MKWPVTRKDEKRIRAADNRAVKKIKAEKTDKRSSRKRPAEASGSTAQMAHNGTASRPQTSATTAACKGTGQETAGRERQGQDLPEDLLLKDHNSDIFKVQDYDIVETFYEYENCNSDIYVKGRLKKSINFWKQINASDFILNVITDGYKILLLNEPEEIFLRNNKSAFDNSEFVSKAILDLMKGGLIREVSSRPHVVNPLTVSTAKNKHRLILDLRHVNKQVVDSKIKFEDWKVVKQYLSSNCFGFVFDKKSGYHHIDIFNEHQKYLGFSWKLGGVTKFFVFTVLPFDDGFGLADNENTCKMHSDLVKSDLIASGFVPNRDKCHWTPTQKLEWLGFIWNLDICKLNIPDRKKNDLIELVNIILNSSCKVKVRLLAKVAGKIISFTPALGHITQIMSRDNQNAVTIVHKGSKVPELQSLAISIYDCCRKNDITIFGNWIPREQNEQADMLSRIVDIDDWRISDEFFTFLNDLWGPFSVDRFASFENTKLQKFNSLYWNPGSLCVDAFTCDWSGENNWLVPPVTEVSRVINHLVKCKAKGTLIVPNWPSSPFWPLIFDTGLKYRKYTNDVLQFNEPERIFESGNNL
ncbi:Hypothetical predicted protein [Mytilus galloprovincialis]|uniref:Reverse transcriptase domain-containing protein n=1 Tax=Mytilus galloprovincialis TaxID=29158 RepID=A0A8B6DW12_MYTGA|nr:Hypothetical predicted protein [Mytilus galloprovincialis]